MEIIIMHFVFLKYIHVYGSREDFRKMHEERRKTTDVDQLRVSSELKISKLVSIFTIYIYLLLLDQILLMTLIFKTIKC